jgi:DNA polymerase III alpha subunit
MLDKFNRYQTSEFDGIELLYRDSNIAQTEFSESADLELYNKFCTELDMHELSLMSEEDYDRTKVFNIPQHYKDIDVEQYVKQLIPHAEDQTAKLGALKRVDEELALYKARNLYPVLQLLIYIIDTMRLNDCVWGVGRGSSVASYVLYLIGIHKIDSIKYNLDITEFLKED